MKLSYFELLVNLLLLSFTIRTARNIFYLTFLWQLKEYRLDRILAHLKTDQGKRLLVNPLNLAKYLFLFFIISGIFWLTGVVSTSNVWSNRILVVAYFFFSFTWIVETILYFRELVTKRGKLPKFTVKMLLTIGFIFICQFFPLIRYNRLGQLIFAPLLDRLLGVTVAFWLLFFNLPSMVVKRLIVILAKKKINKHKNLKVIGITGSFGKTSTKEYLYQILSTKFNVLKTDGSVNTEIGIALTILKNLSEKHQLFIVEMGAYKKGEIEAICQLVKPHIGIITGLNEQHLELFGTLEKLMETKFELIKNLPSKGLAVFNGDNKYMSKMIHWTNKQKKDLEIIKYGTESDKQKYNIYANNIKIHREAINFEVISSRKKESFRLNLIGYQNIENFLAAVAVALNLGLTLAELNKAASRIQAPAKTMKKITGINQTTFIDDTYNANPDGVIAAIEYMKLYQGKKILVLTPLIELGKEAEKIHRLLGRKAAEVCDLILLTNLNYYKSFVQGTVERNGQKKVQIVNSQVGKKLIKQIIDKEGVVIFEGREAEKMLNT